MHITELEIDNIKSFVKKTKMGNTVRRYVLNDAATAYCMGTTRYRVVAIRKDADGGLVELEKLDSACPAIGISGGGSVRSSYDYQSAYGGGTEWKGSEAAWTYVMDQLDRPWRGPELSFHSSGDFKVSPQPLPVSSPPSHAEGQGYEESRRVPRHEYTSGFPTGGRSAIGEALNDGLYDGKSFQENLKGRVDWSKPVSVSGHATQAVTTEHPVVLVEVGGEKISGGNEVRRGAVDV